MNNGNELLQNKNICVNFDQKIVIDGMGVFWATEYVDYISERILIVPQDPAFEPDPNIKYIAIRPKGFEECFAYYKGLPVHKAKILKIILSKITENKISIFKCNFYIPQCAIEKEDLCIFLRISKDRNQFAMIWIKNEELRKKAYDCLMGLNADNGNLKKNSFGAITMEGEPGEDIQNFEKKIINAIDGSLKG